MDNKPFRTEVTLLPEAKPTPYRGATIDTALIQYVAHLDGRIQEVAIDRYAQADDGSVWYFGEDYSAIEDGKVTDTQGTWVVDDRTPAALIMPAHPRVVTYRPENVPEVVFEEVRVDKVDMTVPGPSENISSAMKVNELHMDGTREGKIFAPGYGEFSTGDPGGDLEAVSLASPPIGGRVRLGRIRRALGRGSSGLRGRRRFRRRTSKASSDVAGSGLGCGAYQGHSVAVAVRWSRPA